jgi:haloalkane dehalogenase
MEQNVFIERVLPDRIMRKLSTAEMDAYRRPFMRPDARAPTLAWPRELPIAGEPADVVATVERYGAWLAQAPVPKLFINAEPGSLLVGPAREFCRRWPNQREVTVRGLHFVQEDAPDEIGAALREFLSVLPLPALAGRGEERRGANPHDDTF